MLTHFCKIILLAVVFKSNSELTERSLEETAQELVETVHAQQSIIDAQQNVIEDLRRQLNILGNKFSFVETEYSVWNAVNPEIKRDLTEIQRKSCFSITSTSDTSNNAVSFHSYLSNDLSSLGTHHPIIFDVVKNNNGDAYNHHDGIFTVPTTGTYVFTCSIAVQRAWVGIELVVNSEVIGRVAPDSDHDDDYDTATTIVVQNLSPGDVVFVRNEFSTTAVIKSSSHVLSSFSGWKISD